MTHLSGAVSRSLAVFLWLLAVQMALTAASSAADPVVRATTDVFANDRIDISDAQPVAKHRGADQQTENRMPTGNDRGGRSERLPQQAAGQVRFATAIDANPISDYGSVDQVGFFEQAIGCDSGGFEASCGCETVCDCPVGGLYEEPGCGIESWIEPGCGCEGVGCDSCCDGLNPNCGCNACCGGVGGFIDGLCPRLGIQWHQFDLFGGVNGFTGPMNFANTSATGTDRTGTGSFGFYEGFNKGSALNFFAEELAIQSGVRFTQTNLSGSGFSQERREQIFWTSGIFRRVDYGFQPGVALDYLYEDWYYRGNLIQIRGELGWVRPNADVFGFKFATGVKDDDATTSVINNNGAVVQNNISFEALNQYRLFYRGRIGQRGSCEGFLGWTDNDDGILGVDADLPIRGNLSWNTSATYLIPYEGRRSGGNIEETWNLSIGFTYRPGRANARSRYTAPLLKVADNGSFMVHRK
jgi:hypothetical protein